MMTMSSKSRNLEFCGRPHSPHLLVAHQTTSGPHGMFGHMGQTQPMDHMFDTPVQMYPPRLWLYIPKHAAELLLQYVNRCRKMDAIFTHHLSQ